VHTHIITRVSTGYYKQKTRWAKDNLWNRKSNWKYIESNKQYWRWPKEIRENKEKRCEKEEGKQKIATKPAKKKKILQRQSSKKVWKENKAQKKRKERRAKQQEPFITWLESPSQPWNLWHCCNPSCVGPQWRAAPHLSIRASPLVPAPLECS